MFTPRERVSLPPEINDLTNSVEKACISLLIDSDDSLVHLKQIKDILDRFPRNRSWSSDSMVVSTIFYYLKSSQAKELTWEIREALVNALTACFDIAIIDKPLLFNNVYSLLINELYDVIEKKVRNVPEEYKLALVLCFQSLLKSLSLKCLMDLYDCKRCLQNSSLIWSCLEIAKKEKLRELRIEAMNAIMAMACVLDDQIIPEDSLKIQIVDMFMHFIPGIATSLPQIAAEDSKLGHKIICAAIKCWAKIVHLVMQNYEDCPVKNVDMEDLEEILTQAGVTQGIIETEKKCKSQSEIDEVLKGAARDRNWFRKVDKNLSVTISSFLPLCHHAHINVRLVLAEAFASLLKDCYNTMPGTLAKLIVILLTLSGDDDRSVSLKTANVLQELTFLEEKDARYYGNLFDALEELFYNTVTTLPNSFYNFDDDKKLSSMSLVYGFLDIFSVHRIEAVVNNHAQLRQLICSLVFICELEKLNVNVYEEYSIEDFDATDRRSPWKVFKHFRDPRIKRKIWQVLELLCTSSIINTTVNYIQEIFNTDLIHKKEASLMLNEMISRITMEKELEYFATTVIESYLDPINFSLPIEADDNVTLSEAYDNVIQICLYLEGIGKISQKLGIYTDKLLMKIVYPVIEKAGSSNSLIRLAGMRALHRVAVACSCRDIAELISQNTDYLSFNINRRFKRFGENPDVLNVFTVCMRLSSEDALPSLMSIIEETLFDTCDSSHSSNPKAFLRIFDTFTKCLTRWFNITISLEPIKTKTERLAEIYKERDDMLQQETDFSDEIMGKTATEMYQEDWVKKHAQESLQTEDLTDSDDDIRDEICKPDIPKHIKLMSESLRRTVHTLGSKDDEVKLLALGILRRGLEILRDHDNLLLPLVHQIWLPLVDRLKLQDNELVFHNSYLLLITMARLSKTFIRNRFLNDAKGFIVTTLRKRSKDSFLKDRGSAYRLSQGYKLQVAILENLPRLVTDIELGSDDLNEIFETVEIYLDTKQPKPLRDLSADFFKALSQYDPNLASCSKKYFSSVLNT